MIEVHVKTWNDLQDELFGEAWRPELKRFRSPYAFRGMPDIYQKLETTLKRLGGDFCEKERHLLRNFRKYARRDVVEHDSIWDWLSLAKHHGLPTRLLDWTFSPYVALHFATANIDKIERQAVIWAVNFIKAQDFLPDKLRSELNREGGDVFTVGTLSHVVKTLDDLDALSPVEFPVFFEPPSIDERIVNQYALFSMMSDANAEFEDWLYFHDDLYRKFIIPAELKWEIRDKLDQANITERVLFPGLDGLSSWLLRHYRTRD